MVSTGQDLKMAVWDIRMFREVNRYSLHRPGTSLAISDRGLTAVGWGTKVSVWKGLFDKDAAEQVKVRNPYMAWGGDGKHIERVRWCPFEDVLGVSHDKGFSSLIIPGAGEANFDALELNPYENTKQRQEAEVKALLNKLRPEMISLNPDFIGNLNMASVEQRNREVNLNNTPEQIVQDLKNRSRGKNSSLKRYLRKKSNNNIIDEKRLRIEAIYNEQREKEQLKLKQREEELGPALARFARKPN